jgi:hypothetical protein
MQDHGLLIARLLLLLLLYCRASDVAAAAFAC